MGPFWGVLQASPSHSTKMVRTRSERARVDIRTRKIGHPSLSLGATLRAHPRARSVEPLLHWAAMDALESHIASHQRLLTVQEYLKMAEAGLFAGERVELIRGRVVRMSPMGVDHAWMIQKMNMLLVRLFGRHADVRPQLPMLVSDDTMPEPDFAVVDPNAPDAIEALGNMFIAIEVADSSLKYDQQVKSLLYAEAKVPEYWIVDLRHRVVEVFTSLRGRRYTKHQKLGPSDIITPSRFPNVQVKVAELLGQTKQA